MTNMHEAFTIKAFHPQLMTLAIRRCVYRAVMSDCLRPVRNVLIKFYYQAVFGRRLPFFDEVSRIVRAFESHRGAGDIPVSTAVWESQYRSGYWDWLHGIEQVPHNSVLAGCVRFLKPGGSVMDVGCGEGAFHNLLGSDGYRSYIGIDCSEAAISAAKKHENARTSFVACDATRYVPAETFDAVVFNESLYYFEDPVAVVRRYAGALNPNGIVLTSLFVSARSSAILHSLKALYPLVDEVRLTNPQHNWTWVCSVFQVPQELRDQNSKHECLEQIAA